MMIHPTSPPSATVDEELAATKIQAGFRGYRVRKQMKEPDTDEKAKMSLNGRKVLRLERPADEQEKCATKIQAGIRGFLVRKKQKMAKEAATKIQASFRGFKARQEVKKLKET